MFFNNWAGLGRVLIIGLLAYTGMVLILRISGKRTLSKMNAFDLIVTVALGSSLATVILSKGVALLEGLLAFGLLIGLQYVVAWSAARSHWVRKLIKAEPVMVFYQGSFLDDALRRERLSRSEVIAAMRAQGIGSLEQVDAVVLETAGELSILRTDRTPSNLSTLDGMVA